MSAPDEGRPRSFQQMLGNPWYRLTDIPEFFLCQLRNHALGPLNGSCLESSLPSGDRSYNYLHSREVAQRGRGHIAQGHRDIKLRSCDLNPGSSYIGHYSFFLPWLLSVVDKMHFPNLNCFYKRDRQDIALWLIFLILCHTRHIPTLRPLHCLSLLGFPSSWLSPSWLLHISSAQMASSAEHFPAVVAKHAPDPTHYPVLFSL